MRQPTDRARLERFLRELGRRVRRPVRLYLVGGSVLIALGLRAATLDIDYVATADDPLALDDLERAIRELKRVLDINVEPASPGDFLPIPPAVLDRSRYIATYGGVAVYFYHLPTLVLSKAARGLEQDLADIDRLVTAGEVNWADVELTWRQVRASPTGWLRYEPEEIDERLVLVRRRLGINAASFVS